MTSFIDPQVERWLERRTIVDGVTARDATDLKRRRGTSIGVCLPALDEAGTVGDICRRISATLMGPGNLVDELVVIDSGSTDATTEIARSAGATVYAASELMPEHGPAGGKGDSLWKSLSVMRSDIVVWLDADVTEFDESFVTHLVHPMLEDETILYTKGFYDRPLMDGSTFDVGGGRVTEILVRPLFQTLFPELAGFVQPLSGEYAGRRRVLESVPFLTGYAVEVGLLIDIVGAHGLDAVAQVDLGRRVHRNRSTAELGRTSFEIANTLLLRAERLGRLKFASDVASELDQFVSTDGGPEHSTFPYTVVERPPMGSLAEDAGHDVPPAG